MVGFNYRRVPALALARQLIADGRLGVIREVRAVYLLDWIADPDFPLVWRLQKEEAGAWRGSRGHRLAHHRRGAVPPGQQHHRRERAAGDVHQGRPLGQMTRACGPRAPTVPARWGPSRSTTPRCSPPLRQRRHQGFEASRFAVGRKNAMGIEVYGSGSIQFGFESMNELLFHDLRSTRPRPASGGSSSRSRTTPYLSGWWPPGHIIGYEHTFTNELKDFLECLADGTPPTPSFADGLQVQRVLDAVETNSAARSTWVDVKE